MTPRLLRLKEQTLTRSPASGHDRARLVTEAYRRCEGEPIILRRAAALEAVLREIPVAIHADEVIVGDRSPLGPSSHPLPGYPEWWHGREPTFADPQEQQAAADLAAYWRERPDTWARGTLYGHTVPGFEKVLALGFAGIAAQAQLAAFAGNEQQRNLRLAVARMCCAAGDFGRRHAALARALASAESHAARRDELLAIAGRCDRVPALPARTFAEALQAVYFAHMLMQFEDPPNAQSLGRLDQYLWPYYRADMERGLTEEQARELVACFWIKLWLPYDVQNAMVGGLRPDGEDGANDLSYLVLDTLQEVGLIRQTSVRWHAGAPRRLLHRACEVAADPRLVGQPQFFNDEVIVPSLAARGVPPAEARDYSIIGCIEVTVGGRADPRVVAHYTNLAKCLESALNDGVCMLTGRRLGPSTGPPGALRTYDDLWRAYCAQVEHEVAQAAERLREAEAQQVASHPMPALSALTDDCVLRGLDITEGGARYNSTGVSCVGIANVADSLVAVREVVFEQGAATLEQIAQAMRDDFAGAEPLRRCLLAAPKYGNDLEEVDAVARDVAAHFCRAVESHRDARGGDFRAHLLSFVLCVGYGQQTAATPDGRRARQPLANSMAAQQGMGVAGPTALLRSAAALEPGRAAAGTSLMVDLPPSGPAEDYPAALAALVETFFRLGGGHVQFNIASVEALRDARRDPEHHRALVVRVAGYSAYFVDLDAALQEHIIARAGG